jgi:hypothetical protein
MGIDPADTAAREPVAIHELQDLVMVRRFCSRHLRKQPEDLRPPLEPPERELTDDERVDENEPLAQKSGEPRVASTEMVDPYRRVDEDQREDLRTGRGRRLGTRRRAFSDPPRAASRRALSRAIRASRPAWTIAVFSLKPVRLRALSRRSSSKISVVLICISMAYLYAIFKHLLSRRWSPARAYTMLGVWRVGSDPAMGPRGGENADRHRIVVEVNQVNARCLSDSG